MGPKISKPKQEDAEYIQEDRSPAAAEQAEVGKDSRRLTKKRARFDVREDFVAI
jgi:hypothetical protein